MYIAVSMLAIALTTLVVGLRFYVRAIMIKALGRDDWALLAAYVSLRACAQTVTQ